MNWHSDRQARLPVLWVAQRLEGLDYLQDDLYRAHSGALVEMKEEGGDFEHGRLDER